MFEAAEAHEGAEQDKSAAAATLGSAILLAACGGGDAPAPPAAFFALDRAETRRSVLGVSAAAPAASAASVGPEPTPSQLMAWAERRYPQWFPGPVPDLHASPYVYRHYLSTQNYLGVAAGDVYVLGPLTGGQLTRVGSLADFAPQVLATQHAFSDAAAVRFLRQAQFSASPADMAAVRASGYAAWLQQQFELPASESAWDWLFRKGFGQVDGNFFYTQNYPIDFVLCKDLMLAPDAMRKRMALALSEFFVVSLTEINWEHFVFATYWDLLNTHAFGNFRQLLEEVTLSLAMGIFLNTDFNQKEDETTGRQPDENYAREVMQLFSIGVQMLNLDGTPKVDASGAPIPSFGQDDVHNLARVFTGYGRDFTDGFVTVNLPPPGNITIPQLEFARRPMKLYPELHSLLAKNFLGVSIPAGTVAPADLKIALDTLFQHPNVGPFFGRQMIQRLVTSHPSPAYVARVASAFNDNGRGVRGDLKAVWRAILLDEEARSPDSLVDPFFGKVRNRMLCLVQWGRTFGMTSQYGFWKVHSGRSDTTYSVLENPLRAPSVFGYYRPGYVPPGTALAAAGATAPEFQVVNESTACSYVNLLCNHVYPGGWYVQYPDIPGVVSTGTPAVGMVDLRVDYTREMALVPDFPALVSHLNLLMCAGQLSAATESLIADALADLWRGVRGDGDTASTRHRMVGYALLYVMAAPEYIVQR